MALYESQLVVHCTTPSLSQSGRVPFRLLVDGEVRGETFYTACKFVFFTCLDLKFVCVFVLVSLSMCLYCICNNYSISLFLQ